MASPETSWQLQLLSIREGQIQSYLTSQDFLKIQQYMFMDDQKRSFGSILLQKAITLHTWKDIVERKKAMAIERTVEV